MDLISNKVKGVQAKEARIKVNLKYPTTDLDELWALGAVLLSKR